MLSSCSVGLVEGAYQWRGGAFQPLPGVRTLSAQVHAITIHPRLLVKPRTNNKLRTASPTGTATRAAAGGAAGTSTSSPPPPNDLPN